jgi:hypothetical protein
MIIYDKRNKFGKFKINTAIYFWFRLANRLIRPSNAMRIYCFRYFKILAF